MSVPVSGTNSLDSSNLGFKFVAYINNIITALGITDENMKMRIEDDMKKFDEKSKYKIISDTKLKDNINQLLIADNKLHDLVNNGGILNSFYTKNGENKQKWDSAMEQVARLQGLIILRKISYNDCDGLIKTLLGAFNNKLAVVNNLLASDLESKKTLIGGSDNDYLVKYLKYKNKYLKLLKNNM